MHIQGERLVSIWGTNSSVLALSDNAPDLDNESPDGSMVEDKNDDSLSIFELENEEAKLVPVPSSITCSDIIWMTMSTIDIELYL